MRPIPSQKLFRHIGSQFFRYHPNWLEDDFLISTSGFKLFVCNMLVWVCSYTKLRQTLSNAFVIQYPSLEDKPVYSMLFEVTTYFWE